MANDWKGRAERAEAELERLRGLLEAVRASLIAQFGVKLCRSYLNSHPTLLELARFAEERLKEGKADNGATEGS